MKCPNCNTDLVQTKRNGIDVEYCQSCQGMWLSRQELEQLEDEVFDFGDDKKGSLVFRSSATTLKCPQCGKLMRSFQYRLYDLEMDFCEDGHGYWLNKDEDKRVSGTHEKRRSRSRAKSSCRRQMGELGSNICALAPSLTKSAIYSGKPNRIDVDRSATRAPIAIATQFCPAADRGQSRFLANALPDGDLRYFSKRQAEQSHDH